jgi:hypothetical protein
MHAVSTPVAVARRPRTRDSSVCAEARLAALVRSQAPLRRALAAIAGRLVAIRAWERLGYARLCDYATERGGVSPRQLQDLAHVDRALAGLPSIDVALAAGEIPWTKARLLCRVATPEDEAPWLEAAGRLSARALAREVRAVDGRALENGGAAAVDEDDAWPRETVLLRCSGPARAKWYAARQLARRMAGESLPRWACAEAVAAEVISAIGLEVEPEPEPEPKHSEASGVDRAAGEPLRGGSRVEEHAASPATSPGVCEAGPSSPPSPEAFVESLVAGLESADAFELDARLRRALRLEQRHLARIGPWLLTVASERLFRDLGYRSLDDYAREELGMAPSRARALLRLERLAVVSPVFREAWRAGLISWTQAHALAPLLVLERSLPWHGAWIERAGHVTVRRLENDVDHAVATDQLDPSSLPALPAGLQTGARPTHSEGGARLFLTAPRDVARLFRAVLATVQRHIERARGRPSSQNQAFETMLDHAIEAWGRSRSVPKKYRVFSRDGWRCTVPGCTAYRNLQDHHIQFRSAGGSDDLENRTTLCVWHHLRAVHAGLIRCTGRAPGRLGFALGLREGRAPLVTYASGDLVSGMSLMAA